MAVLVAAGVFLQGWAVLELLGKVSVVVTQTQTEAVPAAAAQVLLVLIPPIQVLLSLKTVMRGALGRLPIIFPALLRNMLAVAVLALLLNTQAILVVLGAQVAVELGGMLLLPVAQEVQERQARPILAVVVGLEVWTGLAVQLAQAALVAQA
jgi:hypothetical protein